MQNNEINWEDKFDTLLQDYFISKESGIKEIKSFISQEIEKSYQRGREEGRGENLSTTESITETLEIPKTIINTLRLQTLEEVERVIKEKASLKTDDKVVDIAILLFSEDILQQLNKMKENERHN